MSLRRARKRSPESNARAADLRARRLQRAETLLLRRLARSGEISPTQCAATVAAALPVRAALRLLAAFRRADWLTPNARIALDALDGPLCPAVLRGKLRGFAQLALFGPAGQGSPPDAQHREEIYQSLSAAIKRDARDENSLACISSRTLSHPAVRGDPILADMLRRCIANHTTELRTRSALTSRNTSSESSSPRPWTVRTVEATPELAARALALSEFERHRRTLEERLLQFDADGVAKEIEQLAALQAGHPDVLSSAVVQRFRMDLAGMQRQRGELEAEFAQLGATAAAAAAAGRHDEAAAALKRLSSMHAARPRLFPESRLEHVRQQIAASGETFEHREASQALVARERAIAHEIRNLAGIVHQFHLDSHEIPHGDPRYAAAEAEYRTAVREIRTHDREWLADLMLELDELLERLHDPSGQSEQQVTRFLTSVRAALRHVVGEIRAIAAERVGPTE